jgi:hypothetical protein
MIAWDKVRKDRKVEKSSNPDSGQQGIIIVDVYGMTK